MTETTWLTGVAMGVEMFDDGLPRPGFTPSDRLPAVIPQWIDEARARMLRRDVATSFSGLWVAGPVVALVTGALLLRDVAFPLTPATTLLRRGPQGWIDGVVTPPVIMESEPAPAVARAAQGLVDVVGPLLEAHAKAGAFGARGLWSSVVGDRIFETATQLVRDGRVPAERLEAAVALFEETAARAPVPLARPEVVEVRHRNEIHPFARKSACCLMYRAMPGGKPSPEACCTSCPLIGDELRAPRWVSHLESRPRP